MTQIDAPNEKYNDYKAPLVKALEHERLVTASINNIYEAALRINDFRTKQFLDWFINEQSEEEKMPMTTLKNTIYLRAIQKVYTCSTMNLKQEYMPRLLWY